MINVTMTGYGTMDSAAPIRADTNPDGVANVASPTSGESRSRR